LSVFQLQPEQQRRLFLVASGVSTAGSFAGITAKGWILMDGSAHFTVGFIFTFAPFVIASTTGKFG
jgi:hypothetical protein